MRYLDKNFQPSLCFDDVLKRLVGLKGFYFTINNKKVDESKDTLKEESAKKKCISIVLKILKL